LSDEEVLNRNAGEFFRESFVVLPRPMKTALVMVSPSMVSRMRLGALWVIRIAFCRCFLSRNTFAVCAGLCRAGDWFIGAAAMGC
jgi:hypothetical protein